MKTQLRTPYLLFIGEEPALTMAKTGAGLAEWARDKCAGQLRLNAAAADLGLPDLNIADAVDSGVGSFVIGVASIGGAIPENWISVLAEAAECGLDIVAGMHTRLSDIPELKAAADRSGVRLIDVRVPPASLPIGSGKKRTGRRLLTVGTDCAVGKKYTALALARELKERGVKADFRASGQTGIMIAGEGIPIDAVVADFISGAAECLSPDNDPDHWDIVEGQGALFHPGYAGVSLGLLHGSQPDAIIVCHEAHRKEIQGWRGYPVPDIAECIERNLSQGALTNPDIQCVGVSINTSMIADEARADYLDALSEKLSLPCVDPIKTGAGPICDRLSEVFSG